jgi:hypothetical protein
LPEQLISQVEAWLQSTPAGQPLGPHITRQGCPYGQETVWGQAPDFEQSKTQFFPS